jgi:hypothetical protein
VRLTVNTGSISIEEIDRLYQIIRENPGVVPLMFDIHTGANGNGLLLKSRRFKVLLSDEFLQKVQGVLGADAVKIGG